MKRIFLASLMGMLISTLAFGVDIKSQIGKEDINFGTGTFNRRTSTGGTIELNKVDGSAIPDATMSGTKLIDNTIDAGDKIKSGSIFNESIWWTSPTYPSVDCTITSTGGHVGHPLDNTYKLSAPYVDVRAHAPVGTLLDGTVDWTTYIQAAIDFAGRTPVHMPAGNYLVTAPIILKRGTHLFGVGKSDANLLDGTRILHNPASLDNVFTVGEPPSGESYTYDIEVGGIAVDGTANTDKIFNLYKVAKSSFHDLDLFEGAHALYITYGMKNDFDRIRAYYQTTANAEISSAISMTTTQKFESCYFQAAPWGLRVLTDNNVSSSSHYGIVFNNSIIESTTVGAIEVQRSASIWINNLYTEDVPTNAVIDNTPGTIFRLFVVGSEYDVNNSVAVINGGTQTGGNSTGYIGNYIETGYPRFIGVNGTKTARSNYFIYFTGTAPDTANSVVLYGNQYGTDQFTNQLTYKTGAIVGQVPISNSNLSQLQEFATGLLRTVGIRQTSSGNIMLYDENNRYGIIRGNNTDAGSSGAVRISAGTGSQRTTEIGWADGSGVFTPLLTTGVDIPAYDNNAAAVAAGLAATTVYKTSTGVLMIVY